MKISARTQRRWDSRTWRAGIAAFGVALTLALGLVWPSTSAQASTPCSSHSNQVRAHVGLPCLPHGTSPALKRCVVGTAGSMAVGGIFGGIFGAIPGFFGGLVGCGVSLIN